jgi:transporter family-2 protein
MVGVGGRPARSRVVLGTVSAELLTGLVLDHFGLLGFDVHQAGWGRIMGGAPMIAGLSLIAIF